MADSTLEDNLNQPTEAEKRINDLSGKVKATADERDAASAKASEAEAKTAEVERERDFYAGFSDVVAENPQAKDHKDDILAKVKAGYSVQDATYAVLGAAGKLGGTSTETVASPAGGSATTSLPSGGSKSVTDMTQEERRAALVEAEARGDIGVN